MNIRNPAGIPSLYLTFLQFFQYFILHKTFHIGSDFYIHCLCIRFYGCNYRHHSVTYMILLPCITDPFPCNISGRNCALCAKYLKTHHLFRYCDNTRLHNSAFGNLGVTIFIREIELPAFCKHCQSTACYNTACSIVQRYQDKINLAANHVI